MRQSTVRFEAQDVSVRTWTHAEAPDNPRKILCFPFSGGGSTAFKPVAAALGPQWQVEAVNPPGHGLGAAHEARDSVPELVDLYIDCLADRLDGAYILGYSVGGYVAQHMLLQLRARGRDVRPAGLVMCAVPPYECREQTYSDLPSDALFDGLTKLGGIPKGVGDPRLAFSMFAHVVRADFRAYERCPEPEGVLDLPTLVIAGSDDPIYGPDDFGRWARFFSDATPAVVKGAHIMVYDNSQGLADAIEDWVRALPGDDGPAKAPPHAS